MDGTSPAAFMNIPALLIIIARHRRRDAGERRHGRDEDASRRSTRRVLIAEPPDLNGRVDLLVSLAEQARREGLLALDAQVAEIEDDVHHARACSSSSTAPTPSSSRDILEAEIDGMAARHARRRGHRSRRPAASPRRWASSAPSWASCTCSQNLSAPATLGPSISSAFIATLMGVGSANVIYLPIANRLKAISAEEVELRTLTLEGILSVQAGDNPRVVAEKLDLVRARRPSAQRRADARRRRREMPQRRQAA